MVKTAVVAGLMLLCGACAPYQAYSGPSRPRGEVAVLVQGISGIVREVDGQKVEPTLSDRVAVLPGARRLTLRAAWHNSFWESVELSFTADAGKEYWVSQTQSGSAAGDFMSLGVLGIVPALAAGAAEFSLTKRPKGGELTLEVKEGAWNGKVLASVTLKGPAVTPRRETETKWGTSH